MKKLFCRWNIWKHIVFSLVISVLIVICVEPIIAGIMQHLFLMNQPSIGVIGGADGPTAIFISVGYYPFIILLVGTLIFIGILLFYKQMKRILERKRTVR